MTLLQKEKYKSEFKASLNSFTTLLDKYCSTDSGDWTVKGFIDVYKNIYTISSDTKIVSKILEIHIFPLILRFAEENGYTIVLAEKQNYYPDITFIRQENEEAKFALDIKTTYRRNDDVAGFTLGSHGTYFKERDKKKNIQFPYNEYLGHYVLGVIYTRADLTEFPDSEIFHVKELDEIGEVHPIRIGERKVTTVDDLQSITSVIKDFDFFSAEKWKIASDGQGSGNTANIGCVLSIQGLKNETGIFSYIGEEWFDEYWVNYGTLTTMQAGRSVAIRNLKDYLTYRNREDLWKIISDARHQEMQVQKQIRQNSNPRQGQLPLL